MIDQNLDSPQMSNAFIAGQMGISERHLSRKINELTQLSPKKYLRQYRIEKSMKFLSKGKYKTVKDTANAIGYNSVSYFISQFEKNFAKRPLEVLQSEGWR